MSRPIDGWASLGAILHRNLIAPPPWVSPATRERAAALLGSLREDALHTLANRTLTRASIHLGIARSTLSVYVEHGWLKPRAGPVL